MLNMRKRYCLVVARDLVEQRAQEFVAEVHSNRNRFVEVKSSSDARTT